MSPFSASSIPRFTAIYVRYKFQDAAIAVFKWFIVLHHLNGYAVCIKTTHRTEIYDKDPSQMSGCVYYKGGQVSCFSQNTAIQPDNQFAIPHTHIESEYLAGCLKTAAMPVDFHGRLQQAIRDSSALSGRERRRIAEIVK